MKVITLRIPRPFSDGPQYDEGGLIQGSWPMGLPHEGMSQVVVIGKANGGLDLCEFIADNSWPISSIPGGWGATSAHIWDGVKQSYTDEDGVFHYGLTTEKGTNSADYIKHIPDDEGGNPVPYYRMHKFQGWPNVED